MSGPDDDDKDPDKAAGFDVPVTFSGHPTHVSEKIELEASGENFRAAPSGFQPLNPPRQLGRYKLTHLIGKGGMAEVFLAKQDGPADFEKTVVVKRIRPVLLEEPKFVDMFLREARIAARLNHTNVVQIFELGEANGEYFIAMEFLDGITLHRAARRSWAMQRSMPMEVVLKAAADAALGLHYAHTLRAPDGSPSPLVHRDISPDNLLLTRDGTTKVLDFGIAKDASTAADQVTMTGEIKGKVPFLSPEQIRGDVLDGRADMWALGITLFWLLTGRRPFDGKTDHMTIDNVLRVDAPSLRELNPLVPVDIDRVVLSMLEKNPADRLKTGLELNAELVRILGPAAGQATTSGFAVEIMDSPMVEKQLPAGELITVIAARPITAWLQRVSNSSDGIHYENLLPEPTPASTGGTFFPSNPEPSTTSKTGELNDLRDEIVGPPRGRPMLLAAAATGLTAVALVIALLVGGGDAPDEDKVVMPAPPTTRAADKAEPPPQTRADAPAANDDAPDTAALKALADAGPVAAEPAVDPAADPTVDEPTKPVVAPTPRRPSGRSLTVKAPARVVWLSSRGKRIGKGSGRITVRPSEKFVTALDAASGLRTRMTVDDRLDYTKLPKGRLSVRVRPWAKVFLGNKVLGTTPLDTVTVVAGTYKVRLEQDDKKTSRTIEVKPGGHAVVKVDMRKE